MQSYRTLRRHAGGLDEVKKKEQKLASLQQSIQDVRNRLHQQKNLYEAVRADRNLYSKNLAEATEEISSMKKKFKVMVGNSRTLVEP